jgi:hypothetical protein
VLHEATAVLVHKTRVGEAERIGPAFRPATDLERALEDAVEAAE